MPHLSALWMPWVILNDGFIVSTKYKTSALYFCHQHDNHKYFSELSDTLCPEWQLYAVGVMWIEMGAILLVQKLYCSLLLDVNSDIKRIVIRWIWN